MAKAGDVIHVVVGVAYSCEAGVSLEEVHAYLAKVDATAKGLELLAGDLGDEGYGVLTMPVRVQ